MLETVLEIALSMGIINVVIWCFRACVCYSRLRQLKQIERHICKCLCYSNLLLLHALKKDNFEADKAIARRDRQSTLLALSPFDREQLEYIKHSGEIHPYSKITQSLHQESGRFRDELLDKFEESGQDIDCDFLGWDYGTPYPEDYPTLLEKYKETMTVHTFSTMQANYFDLFAAIQEIVRYKHKKFQRLFSFFMLVPAAKSRFQLNFAAPGRERIFKESSN